MKRSRTIDEPADERLMKGWHEGVVRGRVGDEQMMNKWWNWDVWVSICTFMYWDVCLGVRVWGDVRPGIFVHVCVGMYGRCAPWGNMCALVVWVWEFPLSLKHNDDLSLSICSDACRYSESPPNVGENISFFYIPIIANSWDNQRKVFNSKNWKNF